MVISEDEEFKRVSYDKFATLKPAFQKNNGEFQVVHWDWKSRPYFSLIINNCCVGLQNGRLSWPEREARVEVILSLSLRPSVVALRARVSRFVFCPGANPPVLQATVTLRNAVKTTIVSRLFL